MSALKEFANFITLNMANLAATYAELLEEIGEGYEMIPVTQRTASARRLLKAVIEAYESDNADPLCRLFDKTEDDDPRRWAMDITSPQPLLEVECLGQTLALVVTNLEASKFLWQILAETRALILESLEEKMPVASSLPLEGVLEELPAHYPGERLLGQETPLEEQVLLRTLVDNLPDYIYIKDAESRFVMGNLAVARLMGAETPDELVGKTDFDFFDDRLAEQYRADEMAVIASGRSLIGREEPVIDPAGNKRWISTTKVPLRDSQGTITGLIGIGRDITRQKQLAQQIQESLEHRTLQLQTITEMAQEIATVSALEQRFQRVVDLVQERFGYCYVNLYILEESELVLRAGAGEAGRQMMADGHTIPLPVEQSLIARAVRSGEPVLVTDVSKEIAWLPHPLLPDTKAELAVPIKMGQTVVGVLNVENDAVGSLDKEDQLLLMGLCGQIAIAINNWRSDTGRKRAEETPQKSDYWLKTIMDSVQAGIVIIDAETREIVDANPAALGMMGAVRDRVIGSVCHRFICPAERGHCPVCDLGQTVDNAERVLLTAQEEVVPIIKNVVPVILEGRKYLVESFVDIRQQKEAEENLLRFKLGIERSSDAVFLTDVDGTITFVNSAFENIYGYSPDEAIGQTPRILKSGIIPPEQYEQFWGTLLAKQVVAGEIINKTEDGRLLNIAGSNNPILAENGDIIGFLSIHRDITEQKRAEEAVAKRAAALETVAQVSMAATSILDTKKLLQTVVDLTKDRFDLYHAHIYLLDETRDMLDLAAGAGKIGRQMVAEGWHIPLSQKQSVVARVARFHEGVIVNNVHEDPGWLPNRLLPDTRSELAVPLVLAEKVVGVLDVQSDKVDYFQDEDLHIHTTLAAQVAVAIQNAEQHEKTRNALTGSEILAREQEVLNELGQALTAQLNVDQVLEEAYRQASRLIDTTNFYIGLYDPEKDEVAFVFDVTDSEIDREIQTISASHGISGYIIRNKTSLLFEDNVREEQEALGIEVVGEEALSWLGIPLMFGDQALGAMVVQSYTTPRLYDEHSREILTAIGSQVAIAIHNATLFERVAQARREAEERLQETQTLQQLTQTLAGTLLVDEVIDAFFQSCTQLLDADYAIFSLVDDEHQRVKAVAGLNVSEDHIRWANHPLDSDDIMADIIRTGQTEVITGWDPRFDLENFAAEGMADWGLRIYIPVTVRRERVGLVEVGFKEDVDISVKEMRIELLGSLVDQTAISLESAQRYEASQQVAEREHTIREITDKLRQASTLDELVRTASSELSKVLGVSHSLVRVGMREPQPFEKNEPSQSENGSG